MTAQTVTGAVANRENPTPSTLVRSYSDDFAAVLPSHIKPATWVRLAQGALKKGKKFHQANGKPDPQGRTELEVAAQNNTAAFLAALLDAARLGLDPGTEQYYLTPRVVKSKLEILGIVGYQGHIELMYRAGAVSSVVVECVFSHDKFRYQPGVDERPVHEIDWDAEDRGTLRLVYAYAVMKDSAISKVVVLNKAAIERIKKSATGSHTTHSPWVNHEEAMWMKSAVRQLQKWVPTSAEYIREQIRAMRDVAAETVTPAAPAPVRHVEHPDFVDGEVLDVTDESDEGDDAEESHQPADTGDSPQPTGSDEPATKPQTTKVHTLLSRFGVSDRNARLEILGAIVAHRLVSSNDLTKAEATTVIDLLEPISRSEDPARALDQVLVELADADQKAAQ